MYCDHCKMQGRIIAKCWKIHGYPPKYKNNTWKKEEDHTRKPNVGASTVGALSNNSNDTRITQE